MGSFFVNANSLTPPQVVDENVAPILDRFEVYSGCYARVSLSFYAFNTNGNKGVACGLGNIQKLRDGEPLDAGRISAESDFGAPASDDFLNQPVRSVQLDRAVERAFGAKRALTTEAERQNLLFNNYHVMSTQDHTFSA